MPGTYGTHKKFVGKRSVGKKSNKTGSKSLPVQTVKVPAKGSAGKKN